MQGNIFRPKGFRDDANQQSKSARSSVLACQIFMICYSEKVPRRPCSSSCLKERKEEQDTGRVVNA